MTPKYNPRPEWPAIPWWLALGFSIMILGVLVLAFKLGM